MRYRILLCIVFAVPAFAQEPSGRVKAADTISITSKQSNPVVEVSLGDSKPAPTIYPLPLPPINLADIARRIRAARGVETKPLRFVIDTDTIVPEEPKQ